MNSYIGSCHCGGVKFTFQSAPITNGMMCNCSHCKRKGVCLHFTDATNFELNSGEELLTEYRFNTKQIEHLFCKICGVQGFGRGKGPDGSDTVAINLNCVDEIDTLHLNITHYDGKNA